jgi:hypothetical protein
LRWSGGLIVTLTGTNAGKWYDFGQDKGGLPIQAIMHNQGLSYVDALKEGARISHLTDSEATEDNASQRPVQQKAPQEDKEQAYRIESAKSIWNATVSAENTLVEEYMAVHRHVYDISQTELRLLPVGAKWINYVEDGNNKGVYIREEKINKVPAMVLSSMDKDNKVVDVQRTYLDPRTANKNTYFDNPKLSKGSIKNGAVLQAGNNGIVYIAEGIETGASIALADKNATVLISMSVGNMQNMVDKIKAHNPKEVIILKDNDGVNAKSDVGFNKAVEAYKQAGFDVIIKEPEMLERIVKAQGKGAKTDWNDVIQENGLYCLCDDLGLPEPKANRNYLVRLYNAKNPKVRIAADSPEAKRVINYVMLENKSVRGVYKSQHSKYLSDAEKEALFDHSVLSVRKSAYELVTDVKTNKYLDKFEQLKKRMYDDAKKYVNEHLKGDLHFDNAMKLSSSKIRDHDRHIAALDKSIMAKRDTHDMSKKHTDGLSL